MKKFLLAIIGPAFLAVGLLSSTTAISDDTKVDVLLIAQGNAEQMACWGRLHICLTKDGVEILNDGLNDGPAKAPPNPVRQYFVNEEICNITCNFGRTDECTFDVCNDRCNVAYATNNQTTCDAPPEFASLMDLLKKSPAVDSHPEEAEAEAVDST